MRTLTSTEAANVVTTAGVQASASTIRRLADAGVLPAVRLTPRSPRRFCVDDVRRLIERAGAAA
jgi:hypothetical protein